MNILKHKHRSSLPFVLAGTIYIRSKEEGLVSMKGGGGEGEKEDAQEHRDVDDSVKRS